MFGKKQEQPTTRLRELSKSDFTIAKGEPDIRGWDVRDAQQLKFATVYDLIFDIRANKVRYMVLNILDTPALSLEKRTVMVPIGLAELDPTDNDVLLPTVNPFQLRALPRYDAAHLGAQAERDVSIVFGYNADGTRTGVGDVDEQFYNHHHFNNNNLYRRRPGHLSDTQHPHAGQPSNSALSAGNPKLPNSQHHSPEAETDEAYFRRTGHHKPRP